MKRYILIILGFLLVVVPQTALADLTINGVSIASGTFTTPNIGEATGTSLDLGATTLLQSREIVVDTGGGFNVNIGGASGDDFTVDATKLVVEGDTGNVGIGTLTPAAKLHVDGTQQYLGTGSADTSLSFLPGTGYDAYITHNSGAAGSNIYFKFATDDPMMTLNADGNVGIGTTSPNQKLTVEGSISLVDQAAAAADTAGYGQIWVSNATPDELYFTDDAGTDTQISSHPLDAPSDLYINGPGLDWICKRVQKYLGVIFWQTLDGTITEETFEAYNLRRKDVPGHVDLVKRDWDTVQLAKLRAEKLQEVIETEVAPADAFEEVEIMEEVQTGTKSAGYEYAIDKDGKVSVSAKTEPVMEKRGTGKFDKKPKDGISFDEKTGKFISKRTRTEAEVDAMNLKAPEMPGWMKTWIDSKTK